MPDSTVDHQATVDVILAAWNEGDFSRLHEQVGPDVVRTSPFEEASGIGELEEVIRSFRAQFPDLRVTVHEILGTGERAAVTWSFTGTNTGEGDFPPTGKHVEVDGVSLDRWRNGKLVEEVVHFDGLSFMEQLGLVEMPE